MATRSCPFVLAGSALTLLAAIGCNDSARGVSATFEPAPGSEPQDASTALAPDAGTSPGSMTAAPSTPSAGSGALEYVEVAGSTCANGTPAGMGLRSASAEHLVLYFNGGGACWDPVSCFALSGATHLSTTYGQAALDADAAPLLGSPLLDDDGIFAGASVAFVPYCTADLHAGDAVRQVQADLLGLDVRTVHHKGSPNVAAFLDELALRFDAVTQIHVIGVSAGGYGAALNYDRIAEAFPAARVDLLMDGAPFVAPQNGLYSTWQAQWNMALPACDGCDVDSSLIVDDLRRRHEDRRFALVTTSNDEVIRLYFGYGVSDMTPAVARLTDLAYGHDNSRAFVAAGVQHVLLGAYHTLASPSGVTLKSFVDGWANGGDGFADVRP